MDDSAHTRPPADDPTDWGGGSLTLAKWEAWRRKWNGQDWPDDPEADERIDWTNESGPIMRYTPEARTLASRYPFPQETINAVLAWSSDPKRIKVILDIMLFTGMSPWDIGKVISSLAHTPASTHPPVLTPRPYTPRHQRRIKLDL